MSPIPFSQAIMTIAYDGNAGVYTSSSTVEHDSDSLIADRRRHPVECDGFLYCCDGIQCVTFRNAVSAIGISDPIEIAEQFLNEYLEPA